jgi:hypothetical protein
LAAFPTIPEVAKTGAGDGKVSRRELQGRFRCLIAERRKANNNTINNLGTITTQGSGGVGDVFGINGNGPLTVNNSGTIGRADAVNNIFDLAGINALGGLTLTNQAGGVILGGLGIQGGGTGTIINSGLISAIGGGGDAINYVVNPSSLTVTNNMGGTITGGAGKRKSST